MVFSLLITLLAMTRIITTPLGQMTGTQRHDCEVYLGVPYAQPPLGDLAFRAPVPVAPWDSVLDATRPKSNCVQEKSRFSATNQDRDCLYLNIYVPHHEDGDTLPVMVWLHGGSFATGGTGAITDSTWMYDMSFFAQQMHAIVVTVNYRLNVFGYLYLRPYSPRFDTNCGMRDQYLALQWVNEYIGCFDGDGHNITLFGQSAGAASVLALMSHPQARKLFHKVIMMSPCMDHFLPFNAALWRTNRYLNHIGISTQHVEKMLDMSDSRIKAANVLFKLSVAMNGDWRCAFSPVIDGDMIPSAPWKGALACRHPMIIGYMENETELFTQIIPRKLLPMMSRQICEKLENDKHYPTHVDTTGNVSYYDALNRAMTQRMFFAPIDTFYHQYQGEKQLYRYTYRTPQMVEKGLGCCHSYEMPVIFGWKTELCDPHDPATQAEGDSIRQSWKSFISTAVEQKPLHK